MQFSKGFCDVLQWHKRLLMSKSLSRKYGSNTQVRMMEETAHTHAKTRQSLACKCDFSLRLVCFAFEFTKQLAAMRNEKTQDETGKKKRGKGKMSTQTELKRRRIDSKRRKKKTNRDSREFSHVVFYIRTHSRVTSRPSSKQFTSLPVYMLLLWKTESMRKAAIVLPH